MSNAASHDYDFDLIVIGSGPGGYRASVNAALRGLRVAILEKGDWGGCCLNRGCVPKKDWYQAARTLAAAPGFAERGIRGQLRGDLRAAWDHQEAVVAKVQESYVEYMKRLHMEAIRGVGTLESAHTVRVSDADGAVRRITAGSIILATGSRPSCPEPFERVPGRVIDTDALFDEPPPAGDRVAVIGSGVIATEFAFILTQLGKEVHWLARSRPLRRVPFTPQAIRELRQAMDAHGVNLREDVAPRAISVDEAGVHLQLEADAEPLTVDWVLLGTGRRPNTEGLGLEALGIEVDARGFIRRNAYLQTSVPTIYAIGDMGSPDMTANHAMNDAAIAVDNICQGPRRARDELWTPMVVYTAIEMARIGMTDDLAEDAEHEPAVGFAAFETSPCALGQGDPAGYVRVLGDMDTGALLGGEVIGSEAGELINLLALAPDRETALHWLSSGAYNHPARTEELGNAVETMAHQFGMDDMIFGR